MVDRVGFEARFGVEVLFGVLGEATAAVGDLVASVTGRAGPLSEGKRGEVCWPCGDEEGDAGAFFFGSTGLLFRRLGDSGALATVILMAPGIDDAGRFAAFCWRRCSCSAAT